MENEKNKRIISLLICIALSIALVGEFVYGVFNNLEEQYFVRLQETGEQINQQISNQVNASETLLRVLARGFENYDDIHCEEALKELRQVSDETNFHRMWLVDDSGHAISSEGEVVYIADKTYVINGMNGNFGISDIQVSSINREKNVIIYAPLYREQKVIGLILGIYALSELSDVVNTECFGGAGSCDVLLSNGEIIAMSENSKLAGNDTFFAYLEHADIRRGQTLDGVKKQMILKESGLVTYTADRHYRYSYYVPLGINDWYLLLSMPENIVTADLRKSTLSALLMVLILLGMAVTMFLFYYREKSLVMRRLIETDSLTGVMTRGAVEDAINEELKKTGEVEFAMLVMDIDNFKSVNDQYGHVIGDKVLRKMAGVLRVEFSTDIVGRLGGDEFGVLIFPDGRSEEEIKEQVRQFITKINKMNSIDGEKVELSASIGVAFAPADGISFNALYTKADERMYSVKTAGKNGFA